MIYEGVVKAIVDTFAAIRAESGKTPSISQWTDNVDVHEDGSVDIMDFIDKGDTATNGRYNYRYQVK